MMNILEFIEKYVTIIDKKTRKKSKFYPSDLQRCLLLAWDNSPMSFDSSRQTGMTTALVAKMAYDIINNEKDEFNIAHVNHSLPAAKVVMDALKGVLDEYPEPIKIIRMSQKNMTLQYKGHIIKVSVMTRPENFVGNRFDAIYIDNFTYIKNYDALKMAFIPCMKPEKNGKNKVYEVSTAE